MPDDPAKPPRFPYIGALLCAACVGAAAYLWMRYSYCWDITPREFYKSIDTEGLSDYADGERAGGETGWYMRISGDARGHRTRYDPLPRRDYIGLGGEGKWHGPVYVRVTRPLDWPGMQGKHFTYTGRVIRSPPPVALSAGRYPRYMIDSTRSRFHGASIAGLVVGAMGVFVFAVALRHWVKERRKFRGEARA